MDFNNIINKWLSPDYPSFDFTDNSHSLFLLKVLKERKYAPALIFIDNKGWFLSVDTCFTTTEPSKWQEAIISIREDLIKDDITAAILVTILDIIEYEKNRNR